MTRKTAAPALVAGLLAGAAILLVTQALTPASAARTGDEWTDWFRSRGLAATAGNRSRLADRYFAIESKRHEFRDPDMSPTLLNAVDFPYGPNRYRAQIVTFPSPELGARIFEDEKRQKIRWETKRSAYNTVQRVGRYAIIVMPVSDPHGITNPPAELTELILDAFEERARSLP